jgi:hypothetical protein
MQPQSRSVTRAADQAKARDLIYEALCTMFGADTANLIIGAEVGDNPRPLAGLSPEQLGGVNSQLQEMGIEIRQTLNPESQIQFELSLDAAQEIVAAETQAKAGAPAPHRPEGT